ncbi:glycosyltransferase family 2 protein [Tychonema sp. BBK16]|uniref:glycosyltransferase family 2 protein n=1 Tax=Tychonema sp. BBK16 TaxID=2699888 RepID=UPI001F324E15|nr:cellulose synthase catalytic subunit [Tychonema sp. BBK16]MCF6373545.1 glycosyltransferase [Tychonema sp. BBK16]
MANSRFNLQGFKHRVPIATLVVLGLFGFASTMSIAWLCGQGTVSDIFTQINIWQQNPPVWTQVPAISEMYLLIPTVILVSTVFATIKISPQPQKWSQAVVISIVLALTIRYVLWRSLATLNLSNPLNGIFSLGLFFLEMLMIFSSSIQLYLMLRVKDRRAEADRMAIAVESGDFAPTVDIFIPTYNEPAFILRRTIIGCQALNYHNKTIYLLDDTQRPEIKLLSKELGCEYISRPEHIHAKAGNINHAKDLTTGELIVVFDADFIPTTNFLARTIGFFQNPEIALVQTPQSFYNHDPIARNLGLENILTSEEEVFYRQIQIIKDGAESVVCCGTSFVLRRSALEAVGGFVTNSVCEDYFTGIRLSATGYRLVYLNEKLSAGLAAENIDAHLTQRLRWAQGTLQAFFIDSNPLTIHGLKFRQRLSHLEGLLHWFTSLTRVLFLFIPLAYWFLGILPLRTNSQELLYFFLPYYSVQLTVFAWLNRRSRSALLSDVYSFVQCIPLAVTVVSAMLNPFGKGFKVTPKGIASDRFHFNWNLGWPLIILFVATACGLCQNLNIYLLHNFGGVHEFSTSADALKGTSFGWIWSAYNLLMLGIALLILVDIPKPDIYEWFNLRRVVQLNINGESFWGITTMISESGAEVTLTQQPSFASKGKGRKDTDFTTENLPKYAVTESLSQGTTVKSRQPLQSMRPLDKEHSFPIDLIDCDAATLEIMEEKCLISVAKIELVRDKLSLDSSAHTVGFPIVRIAFDRLNISQHRCLIEMLYCRPGQWLRQETPGELRSLWLLLKIAFKPRAIFERDREVRAIAVSQV